MKIGVWMGFMEIGYYLERGEGRQFIPSKINRVSYFIKDRFRNPLILNK